MAKRPYNIFPNGLASVQPVKKSGESKLIIQTFVYGAVLNACAENVIETSLTPDHHTYIQFEVQSSVALTLLRKHSTRF